MPFDPREAFTRHRGEGLSLLEQYINPRMARVLKTLGFDPVYVRGQGAHLWDDKGNDYFQQLSCSG